MAYMLGIECKLMYGTAGTTASTEIKNIKDVTLNLSKGDVDFTTRAAGKWQIHGEGLKDVSISGTMLYDSSDSCFVAIRSSFFSGTPISLFVGVGDGEGLDCDVIVSEFNIQENNNEPVSVEVSFLPTMITGSTARAPEWVVPTSGGTGGQ